MLLLVFATELWWINQERLKLRWGHTTDQKIAAVHGMLCTIPPHNSNRNILPTLNLSLDKAVDGTGY
jgi:hypothetical protein